MPEVLSDEKEPEIIQIPFLFIYCFLGLHLWHMEVLRLGVRLEL